MLDPIDSFNLTTFVASHKPRFELSSAYAVGFYVFNDLGREVQEKFQDTKGVIRKRKLKNDIRIRV